jgi:hypothetical protein
MRSVTFWALSPPLLDPLVDPELPDLFTLIEATSYVGRAWPATPAAAHETIAKTAATLITGS